MQKKILFLSSIFLFFGLMSGLVSSSFLYGLEDYWVSSDPPKCHYSIDARIQLEKGVVEGEETIDLKNPSPGEISIIAFKWPHSLTIPLKVTAANKLLKSLNWEEGATKESLIFYQLSNPLAPGANVKLSVIFKYQFKTSPEDAEWMETNWYPQLWWDGLPVHNSYSVKLETPKDYALAASGRFNTAVGRYEIEGAKTFGIYLGKNQRSKSREVEGVLITSLFTDKGAQCAAMCLETAVDCIAFYKQWLGFYPFKFLYIIPGGKGRWGGYPFATGLVVIHGQETYKPEESRLWWQWITAHEIGHEYWGEWVLDPDNPAWLWIGMGIFADTKYLTTKQIDLDRRYKWMREYINGVYNYYDTTVDIPPSLLSRIKYDRNNIVTHSKGFSIISALDSVLGRETFEKIYKQCLRLYGGKRLSWKELQRVCEAEIHQSLNWFFNQWVRSDAYLHYQVESQQSQPDGSGFLSLVRIKRLGTMKMPVPVKAIFEDNSEQVQFTNRCLDVTLLKFISKAKLKKVIIDPEKKLAMLERPLPEIPDDIAKLIAFGWGMRDVRQIYEELHDMEIDNWRLWNRLGYYLFKINNFSAACQCYIKVLELPIEDSAKSRIKFQVLANLGILEDLLGNRQQALAYYREALIHDTGDTLNYSWLKTRIHRKWLEERLQIPFILHTKVKIPEKPDAHQLIKILEELDYTNEGETPLVIFKKTKTLTIDNNDFWYKLGLLLFDSDFYSESFSCFNKVLLLEPEDQQQFAALTWMGHLKDLQGEREKALDYYKRAIKLDNHTNITMHHDQYGMKIDRYWVKKRLKTPFTK
jgi:tetratricopeptide (TPR) repeat protein